MYKYYKNEYETSSWDFVPWKVVDNLLDKYNMGGFAPYDHTHNIPIISFFSKIF